MRSREARAKGAFAARVAAFAISIAFGAVPLQSLTAGAQPAGTPPAAAPSTAGPPAAAQSAAAPLVGAPPPTAMSPPGAPEEDIRDIRGPKYLAPAWLVPAGVAGVTALVLLSYALWRWLRRRRDPRVLSSSEAALERLEHIRALMQPATVREFSIEVSDVVRRYIERGFDITATHRTTEEFLRDLLGTSHPALTGHRDLLSGFLEQCDLAKFAGMTLSLQNMELLHASARSFVIESSKPAAAPARAPKADAAKPARAA